MAANYTGKGHTVVVVDSGAGTYYQKSKVIYDHDFVMVTMTAATPGFSAMGRR